jgi:competence protein ComEA
MKKDKEVPDFISRKTKRGILLLVFLCLLIIYTPRLFSLFKKTDAVELTQLEIEKMEQLQANYIQEQQKKKKNSFKKREYRRPPKKFDPNQYSKAQWMYVGLSDKQAEVMLKITKKGIWTNEFLAKIVVIPEEVFQLIKDSTIYPERKYKNKEHTEYPKYEKKEIVLVEINTADLEGLKSMPGIGPSYALRINAYKELLGGFVRKEQLLEVYGLDLEKLDQFEKYCKVDPSAIVKMNINEVDVNRLKMHPYINYSVANSIVQMRKQKGKFNKIEELKESKLINPELFEKLKPYVYL